MDFRSEMQEGVEMVRCVFQENLFPFNWQDDERRKIFFLMFFGRFEDGICSKNLILLLHMTKKTTFERVPHLRLACPATENLSATAQ